MKFFVFFLCMFVCIYVDMYGRMLYGLMDECFIFIKVVFYIIVFSFYELYEYILVWVGDKMEEKLG